MGSCKDPPSCDVILKYLFTPLPRSVKMLHRALSPRRIRTGIVAVLSALVTTIGIGLVATSPASAAPAGLKGMDVSGYQGNVNWSGAWANGARWAYIKATEGTYYTNPYFAQ